LQGNYQGRCLTSYAEHYPLALAKALWRGIEAGIGEQDAEQAMAADDDVSGGADTTPPADGRESTERPDEVSSRLRPPVIADERLIAALEMQPRKVWKDRGSLGEAVASVFDENCEFDIMYMATDVVGKRLRRPRDAALPVELRATFVWTQLRRWVCLEKGARFKDSGQLYLYADKRSVRKIITLFGNPRRAQPPAEPDPLIEPPPAVFLPEPKGKAVPLHPKRVRVDPTAMELDGDPPLPQTDVEAAITDAPEMTSEEWQKVAKEQATLDDDQPEILDVDRDMPDVELPPSGGHWCGLPTGATRRQIDTWVMKNHVGMGHASRGEMEQALRDAGAAQELVMATRKLDCPICDSF